MRRPAGDWRNTTMPAMKRRIASPSVATASAITRRLIAELTRKTPRPGAAAAEEDADDVTVPAGASESHPPESQTNAVPSVPTDAERIGDHAVPGAMRWEPFAFSSARR